MDKSPKIGRQKHRGSREDPNDSENQMMSPDHEMTINDAS